MTVALAALVVVPFVWLLMRDHPADVGLAPYGGTYVEKPAPAKGAATRTLRVLADAARTGPFWLLAGTFAICGASTNGLIRTHFVPSAHDHGMPITAAASLLAVIGGLRRHRHGLQRLAHRPLRRPQAAGRLLRAARGLPPLPAHAARPVGAPADGLLHRLLRPGLGRHGPADDGPVP
ncbi:hypothetical protein GCM10020227_42710 [Streptomyces flavovirens]